MSKRARLAKLEQAHDAARVDLTVVTVPIEDATVTGFDLNGQTYPRRPGESVADMHGRLTQLAGARGIHIAHYLTD